MSIAVVQVAMATASATSVTINSGSTDPWATPSNGNAILLVTAAGLSLGTISNALGKSLGWSHTNSTDLYIEGRLWVSDGTETSLQTSSTNTQNWASMAVELSGVGSSAIFVTDTNGGSSQALETEGTGVTTVGSASFGVPYNDTAMFCALATQALSGGVSASPTGYTAVSSFATRRLNMGYKLGCSASTNEPATGTWTWTNSSDCSSVVFGVNATPVGGAMPVMMAAQRRRRA